MKAHALSVLALLGLTPMVAARSQAGHDHTAMHAGGDSAYQAMKARGRAAMGVDQERSTHRFTSLSDGGRIELTSDGEDSGATAAIRRHFADIEKGFAAGDFSIPAMVHAQDVPGTNVMRAKASVITYRLHEVPRGAQLHIITRDKTALAAVHRFLRFQRTEHHAGQ